MSIWKFTPNIEMLNSTSVKTMGQHLGIEFTEVGDDYIKATMPVDERTVQPYGVLHGGANVTLAETLGSVAGGCCVDYPKQGVVGVEINANHLKGVKSGLVEGIARPIRIGKTIHVWEIKIYDDKKDLSCISRLTLAVISLG